MNMFSNPFALAGVSRISLTALLTMAFCTGVSETAWAAADTPASEVRDPNIKVPEAKSPDIRAADAKGVDTKKARRLISLDRPGEREFVRDEAHLLNDHDKEEIKKIADKLLTDKATPVLVITINSMAAHTDFDMRIEAFAQVLFDQWGIGVAKLNGEDWNTGILLLVSKSDRKARIELGAGWKHDHDRQCDQIMEQIIIPNFKKGDFSGGILAGVEALDKMARGLKLPASATMPAHQKTGQPSGLAILLMVGLAGLAIFTIVSLVRNGAHGWGWLLWAAVFAVLGTILYTLMTNSGGSGSGGGYSGGSFGDGSAGGGGSTGSW